MHAPPQKTEPTRATKQAPQSVQQRAQQPALLSPELALHRALGNQGYGQLLQTKLNVGPPNDRYEQEADRIAEQVMRMPAPVRQAHDPIHVIRHHSLSGSEPIIQRNEDDGDKDNDKKDGGGTSKEKKQVWSRKHTDGPRLLDGRKPSYQVWFDHILPPVPKGVTQMWQVVEVERHALTDKCKVETEKVFVVDIVDLGTRTKINDDWGWIRRDDPCFAMEASQATVGFDDKKSDFAQQTSVKVTESLAKKVLGKMDAPKGTYTGMYTFVKGANCKDCPGELKKLQEKHGAPEGEALSISGVGKWIS